MIRLRKASERGASRLSWLESRHSFSFASYYDPEHMGFRALRVINDDRVAAGAGFGPHPHRDMEIVTVVLDGELLHRDSGGHESRLRAGAAQHMGAGTGVVHSEMNGSADHPVKFLQIWIEPEARGLAPAYAELPDAVPAAGGSRVIASPDGRDGSLVLRQDAAIERWRIAGGRSLRRDITPGRHAWLHVVSGRGRLDDVPLEAGDGVAVSEEASLLVEAAEALDVLYFDLA